MVKCTRALARKHKLYTEDKILKFTKSLHLKESTVKKAYSCLEKVAGKKKIIRGVKQVVKAVRNKIPGLVILAGDVSPADVILHLPIHCINNDTPFFFVEKKRQLGEASQIKRATCCVFLRKDILTDDAKYQERIESVMKKAAKKVKVFKEKLNKCNLN